MQWKSAGMQQTRIAVLPTQFHCFNSSWTYFTELSVARCFHHGTHMNYHSFLELRERYGVDESDWRRWHWDASDAQFSKLASTLCALCTVQCALCSLMSICRSKCCCSAERTNDVCMCRYYYARGILNKVDGQRLVYQFAHLPDNIADTEDCALTVWLTASLSLDFLDWIQKNRQSLASSDYNRILKWLQFVWGDWKFKSMQVTRLYVLSFNLELCFYCTRPLCYWHFRLFIRLNIYKLDLQCTIIHSRLITI